jgi:DNA-binding transcriptional LysR family regulator
MAGFDWNDLRYFLEVARVGTLSGAARVLGADHATVSRRINALEHALGKTLFNRSLSGYVLTPAGEDLLGHAEQMEALALRADAERSGATLGGVIRLATPDGFGNFFFSHHLDRFTALYPRLTVQLVPIQQSQAQSQREGDIAVTLTPAGPRFVSEKLTSYNLGLYASPHYLTAHGTPTTRDALRPHRLVGYIEDLLFSRELDYLDEVLPGLRARIQCSSLLSQANATRAGAGICVLPHYLARQIDGLVPLLREEVSISRTYWLNIAPDAARVPRIRTLADFIRQSTAEADFN